MTLFEAANYLTLAAATVALAAYAASSIRRASRSVFVLITAALVLALAVGGWLRSFSPFELVRFGPGAEMTQLLSDGVATDPDDSSQLRVDVPRYVFGVGPNRTFDFFITVTNHSGVVIRLLAASYMPEPGVEHYSITSTGELVGTPPPSGGHLDSRPFAGASLQPGQSIGLVLAAQTDACARAQRVSPRQGDRAEDRVIPLRLTFEAFSLRGTQVTWPQFEVSVPADGSCHV